MRLGSGISNVNLDYAKKKNIKIFSSPLPTIRSVTELTVGALLVLIRNLDSGVCFSYIFRPGSKI